MSFYTDTIQRDSRFRSWTRINDAMLLEPVMRAAIDALIAEGRANGTQLVILETYRSSERQEYLYRHGATQLETVGVHHYGLACDLGIMIGGEVNWKAKYDLLGPLAAKHKLVWGGTWGEPNKPHTFRDYDHLQRIAVADQPRLFSGQWYPNETYVAPELG